MAWSRRGVVGAIGGCALCRGTTTAARVAPASMQPLIGDNYQPVDSDERGMWQSLAQFETELASSNLLLGDAGMQAYVTGVMSRLLGNRGREVRVYLVHDPDFNAAMTPTGAMIVNTGLLARVRNEAQLAAVLGHESGHYLRRHQIASFRNNERKQSVMAFVAAGANVVGGVAAAYGGDGRSWLDLARSVNNGILLSIFRFDREQESEADAYGLRLMVEAGYDPDAAPTMWAQLTAERRASAAARSKRYRDNSHSAFSTHPPTDVRMVDLTASARDFPAPPPRPYRDGRDEWRAVVAPLRATLLEEQVRQNDPGASLYLVNALAADGWDGTLRYFEGEVYRLRDAPGDAAAAAQAYATAVDLPDAPAEAWRQHGYALVKAGHGDDGRRALARYLDAKPQASDAAMVRFSIAQ